MTSHGGEKAVSSKWRTATLGESVGMVTLSKPTPPKKTMKALQRWFWAVGDQPETTPKFEEALGALV